jgi:hypothetical protein
MRRPRLLWVLATASVAAIFAYGRSSVAIGQGRPGSAEAGFESAQKSLAAAAAELDSYTRRLPAGKYETIAKIQLAALQNLMLKKTPPVPVTLASYQQKVQWAVDKVERTADATRVTIKVINLSTDQDCQFIAFTDNPLVIMGDDRELYAMTARPIKMPKGVRETNLNIVGNSTNNNYWVFQGGRTLSLEVEFERMPDGVAGGHVQYLKPVAGAVPLLFSLVGEKPAPSAP